jgi:AcrR family transcriptional regulator
MFRLIGTKEALFVDVVRDCFAEIASAFRHAATSPALPQSPDERLQEISMAYVDVVAHRDLLLIQLQATAACTEPAIREAVREGYGSIVELLGELTGADDAAIRQVMAVGMLSNSIAAMDAEELCEPWARTVDCVVPRIATDRSAPRGCTRAGARVGTSDRCEPLDGRDGWQYRPLMGFLRGGAKKTSTGRALIVSAQNRGMEWTQHGIDGQVSGFSASEYANISSKLTIRVVPDDGGPEFDSTAGFRGHTDESDHARKGFWTYVRYDSSDPGECEIDRDRLVAEFGKHHKLTFPEGLSAELTAERKARADGTLKPGEKFDPLANVTSVSLEDDRTLSAASASTTPGADDVVTRLTELTELHAKGALSDAEFAAAKSRILGN